MKIYSDAELAEILDQDIFHLIGDAADHIGVECYVVGGYVRDIFLERPSNDIDVVVVGSGIVLAEEVKRRLGRKAHLSVFRNFGTAQVKTYVSRSEEHGVRSEDSEELELEFVGARRESYSHDSRKPIVEDGTLEDDQNRRDFTINAMAICLNRERFGELVDPFDGLYDLEDGIIRTPLDPDITFSDDPLRMLRCIRFATQLNFFIEEETFDALERNAERIKIISGERIADELNKMMMAPHPSKGWMDLHRCGLLPLILPELSDLDIVETRNGRAHKNNFYHTLEVLENVVKVPLPSPPRGEAPDAQADSMKTKGLKGEAPEAQALDRYKMADPAWYGRLKENAVRQRKDPTDAERALWQLVRGKILGFKFRRQHVIDDFIVDFVCLERMLVIEVDGGYHQDPEQHQYDEARTRYLEAKGFRVMRFTNEEVLLSPDPTLSRIREALLKASPIGGDGRGASLWLRWAALLHDIGKPKSKRWDNVAGWTFHNHNYIGAKMVPEIFRRLKQPLDAKMKYVQKLVDLHMRPIVIADEEVTDSAVRRLMNDAGDDIDDLMTLCEADITSKNEVRKKHFRENFRMVREKLTDLKEKDYKRLLQPVIDGNEIMELFQLKPSKEVGELKQYLKDAVLDNRVPNEREPLMQLLLQKAREMGLGV